MSENNGKKKMSRGLILDIIVALLAVIVLGACCFFWGCKYDMPVTILAFALVLAGSGFLFLQHKRNTAGGDM